MARSRSPIPQHGDDGKGASCPSEEEGESERSASPTGPSGSILDNLQSDPFPWEDTTFCVLPAIPDVARDILTQRIEARGGILAHHSKAQVIVTLPSTREAAVNIEAERLHDAPDCIIVFQDWLANVYFTGVGQPHVPAVPPLTTDDEQTPLVSVPAGDNEWRLKMMTLLECNGALVVPYEESDICVLPTEHRLDGGLDGIQHMHEEDIWSLLEDGLKRQRETTADSNGSGDEYTEPANKRPRRQAGTDEEGGEDDAAYSPRRKKVHSKSQKAAAQRKTQDPAPTATRNSARTPYSTEDRDNLARWLAYYAPLKDSRTRRALYNSILEQPWASRHSASSWHEHYRKHKDVRGPDENVLEELVEMYIKARVDSSLRTAMERREARRKRQQREESQGD